MTNCKYDLTHTHSSAAPVQREQNVPEADWSNCFGQGPGTAGSKVCVGGGRRVHGRIRSGWEEHEVRSSY